jgi:hypothetical protein
MTIPNREPDFSFPDTWRVQAPDLWQWVQDRAQYIEPSIYRMAHDVWFPIQDEQEVGQ